MIECYWATNTKTWIPYEAVDFFTLLATSNISLACEIDPKIDKLIEDNNHKALERILKKGFDPNCNGKQTNYLESVAAVGDLETAKLFSQYGANWNLVNNHVRKETPLFFAIDWSRLDMIDYLIKQGANVNAKTSHGYSCLHMAASSGTNALEMVKLLINAGADKSAVADNGVTVLKSAEQSDNADVVEFLKQ